MSDTYKLLEAFIEASGYKINKDAIGGTEFYAIEKPAYSSMNPQDDVFVEYVKCMEIEIGILREKLKVLNDAVGKTSMYKGVSE